MKLSKEFKNWFKYENVRRSGTYNMIMESSEASKVAKMTLNDYTQTLKRYGFIKPKVEEQFTQEEIDKHVKEALK